jgi:hypothetical protein
VAKRSEERSGIGTFITEERAKTMGLYDVMNAVGQGLGTGYQTYDALQQRDRQQEIEDERLERERRLSTIEHMLMEQDYMRGKQPPGFEVNVGGIRGTAPDAKSAVSLRSLLFPDEAPEPPRTGIVRSGNRNALVNMTTGDTVRDFDPIESPGGGGTDPMVSRRQMLQEALSEIDEIYAGANEFGSSPELLTQANQRANAVARRRGFTTLRELIDAARQMNIDLGVIAQPAPAASPPESGQRPTLEQRIRELRAQGVEREEARRMLAAEGYDVR